MDSRTAKGILPVYADILAQLCSDEAKMLRCLYLEKGGYAGIIDVNSLDDNFALLTLATGINTLVYDAKCDIPENNQIYIDNLSRLQLIKIDMINGFVDKRHYERLIQLPQVLELKSNIEVLAHKHFNVTRGRLLLSELGKGLCEACSVDIH